MPPCSDTYREEDFYDRMQKATRVACELARVLKDRMETNNETHLWKSYLSVETRKWVKAHEDSDKKRLAQEKKEKERKRAREKILLKLTKKERIVLLGEDHEDV